MYGQVMVPEVSNKASSADLQRLVGTPLRGEIRSWKGDWGFVICPAKFHGDVFVHKDNLQLVDTPVAGQKVSFTIGSDQRGRMTAVEVTEPNASPEDFLGSDALDGQVRSWKKEWGFIVSDNFDGDLFCHQDGLHLEVLEQLGDNLEKEAPGRIVTFEVGMDKRGRICAQKVVFGEVAPVGSVVTSRAKEKALALPPDIDIDPDEELYGTLRSWKEPWGFIVCPERFEGDLFAHRDAFVEAPPPRADVAGADVAFRRTLDRKGRPGASQVRFLEPHSIQVPEDPTIGAATPSASVDENSPHIPGIVRSWKGDWGFIIAPEHLEGDVFAHKDHISGGHCSLAADAAVTFQVGADEKGRQTAVNIQSTNRAEDWLDVPTRLRGSFRSWKQEWGFIVSGSFTGDLFTHMDNFGRSMSMEHARTGVEVAFYVKQDMKGRPTAVDVGPAPTPISGVKRPFGGPVHQAKRPKSIH
jgi:cold shock CspA family protein